MDEPMIPKSMHDSAVEASRIFGRQEAEREALRLIAAIVDAAGGRVEVSRRSLVESDADVVVTDDFVHNVSVFATRRHSLAEPSA
jgi:hypothetical protein